MALSIHNDFANLSIELLVEAAGKRGSNHVVNSLIILSVYIAGSQRKQLGSPSVGSAVSHRYINTQDKIRKTAMDFVNA